MTQTSPPLVPSTAVFERKASGKDNVTWYVAGGVACLAFGVVGFLLGILSDPSIIALQFTTTLPILLGGVALVTAWRLSRTPLRAVVSPEGLRVETSHAAREWTWEQIGWCTVTAMSNSGRSQLVIYDTAGKTLVKIADCLEAFETFVEMVKQRVEETNADVSETLRTRKSKRSAMFLVAGSVFLLAIVAASLYMTRETQRTTRLLEEAVPGEGTVEELRIAPNGITRRLIYRVTSPNGESATRNAEVTADYWDDQEVGGTVPILYVPEEPKISRLAVGEVAADNDITDNPMVMYGLCAALTLMCVFFLVGAVLQWYGWDIDLDSKTHKISIKRFGSGR